MQADTQVIPTEPVSISAVDAHTSADVLVHDERDPRTATRVALLCLHVFVRVLCQVRNVVLFALALVALLGMLTKDFSPIAGSLRRSAVGVSGFSGGY